MPLTEGQLRLGRLFESEFERQAHNNGKLCVRHCDQLGVNGTKAPMVTGKYQGYRLPDFSVLTNGEMWWVECKYKTRNAYYGQTGEFTQGIDLPNWRDYLAISELSGQPGALVLGIGCSGEIVRASFRHLLKHAQEHRKPHPQFPGGAVFWPRWCFSLWGRMNPINGQMTFDFCTEAEE